MTNLFTNLSKNGSDSVNGSRMDRHYIENGPMKSRQLFAVLVMLWVKLVNLVNFVMQIFKLTKLTKLTEQIFEESLKSLKSLMQIFATSATFASANFVGKESNEGTEMYRVKSRIPSCYLRYASVFTSTRIRLASLICLCMLTVGVGNVWGATGAISVSSVLTLPSGSTSNYTSSYWQAAGAPAYSTSNDNVNNITISSTTIGSIRFYHAGYSGNLQLQSGNGYIETVLTSTAGVDVKVYMKSNGASGSITATLTYTGGSSSQTVTGTTFTEKTVSTTATSATLRITTSSNAGQVGYIVISPKAKYTVTFYNAYGASTPDPVTQASVGAAVTIPSASPSSACSSDGWEFAGWKTGSYQTSDATYLNGLISAGSYTPTSDLSLYAVFRKEGDATSTTYSCTSTSSKASPYEVSTAAGGYTISLAQGNSSSWYQGSAPWRLYSDGTKLTVSGCNPISKLDLIHSSTYYASFSSNIVGSTVTMASSSGGTTTVTDINANSITLTSGGSAQNRISSIKVYYTAYTYRSNPSCCTPLASINGSFFWTPLFEPLSPDNSWLKTHMEQVPYFLGPISYPAPLIYTTYISRDFAFCIFRSFLSKPAILGSFLAFLDPRNL